MIRPIGKGLDYTAYRVGDVVYKVPNEYLRALEQAGKAEAYDDFDVGPVRAIDAETLSDLLSAKDFDDLMDVIGPSAWQCFRKAGLSPLEAYSKAVRRGRNAVYASKRFAEFGAETKTTPIGIIIQEYVEGERPGFGGLQEFKEALFQRGIFKIWPPNIDIHPGNVFRTREGYKAFDFASMNRKDFRKDVKTIGDVVNEQSRKAIENLLKKKEFLE